MNLIEGLDVPTGFAAAVFSLGELLTVSIVKAARGPVPLLWSAEECIRLRSVGRVSVSPVGQCSVKIESNGKAAAVPAILSDEELSLIAALGWARFVDAASGAELAPSAVLAASLAGSSCPIVTARLRRIAFLDLWAKGYRMTSGIKFGVDWLTYRGDPTSCHAAFMVTVLPAGAPVAPLELIARSRVATTALKICAFAYVSLGGGDMGVAPCVSYQAFRRMGVGAVLIDPTAQTTADTLRSTAGLGAALAALGMSLEPTVVPPPPAIVAAVAAAAAARAVLLAASAAAEADGVPVEGACTDEGGAATAADDAAAPPIVVDLVASGVAASTVGGADADVDMPAS